MKPKPAIAAEVMTEDRVTVEPECLIVIETGDPRWDRARAMWEECQKAFWKTTEGMVMLGCELLDLRKRLGFEGSGGDHRAKPHDVGLPATHKTWSEWCFSEIGLSAETVSRYIKCFQAVQVRARAIKDDSLPYRLLGTPACELDDKDRAVLRTIVTTLINGDSQKHLLQDLRINKPQKPLSGGDTSKIRAANLAAMDAGIAADMWNAAFGSMEKAARLIAQFRRRQDLERWLYLLPLVPEERFMGLQAYREEMAKILQHAQEDMAEILKTLDRFIAAKHESNAATVRNARRIARPANEPSAKKQ